MALVRCVTEMGMGSGCSRIGERIGDANLFLTKLVALIQRGAMLRRARIAPRERVHYTLDRANRRSELFSKSEDYAAFERINVAAIQGFPDFAF